MSGVLRPAPPSEPMTEPDLRAVLEIEEAIYAFPWTPGNFRDSLRAGYSCWGYRDVEGLIGYAVLVLAAGGAHLLNLSVAARPQSRGHWRSLPKNAVCVAPGPPAQIPVYDKSPL